MYQLHHSRQWIHSRQNFPWLQRRQRHPWLPTLLWHHSNRSSPWRLMHQTIQTHRKHRLSLSPPMLRSSPTHLTLRSCQSLHLRPWCPKLLTNR